MTANPLWRTPNRHAATDPADTTGCGVGLGAAVDVEDRGQAIEPVDDRRVGRSDHGGPVDRVLALDVGVAAAPHKPPGAVDLRPIDREALREPTPNPGSG